MSRLMIVALALLLASPAVGQSGKERVLLPVFADVEGGYGTSFVTELRIYNSRPTPIEVEGLTLACTTDCPADPTKVLIPPETVVQNFVKDGKPWKLVRQPKDAVLYYSLRVRDLSRQEKSNGVEIPVVTYDDFRPRQYLLGVDLSSGFRSRVRIYGGEYIAFVAVYREEDGTLVHRSHHFMSTGYLEVPLPVMEGRFRVVASADAGSANWDGPVWAMVTTTNNETQEITVVTPHRVGPYAPPYPWD